MRVHLLILLVSILSFTLLTASGSRAGERPELAAPASLGCPHNGRLVPGLSTAACPGTALSAAPQSAIAGATGSISGTVTEEGTGLPLEDVCVRAELGGRDPAVHAMTNPAGTYALSGLEAYEAYKLHFTDCSLEGNHHPEWYGDRDDYASADLVIPTPDAQASAALSPGGGSITGTVTGEGGAPLADFCILAFDEQAINGVASWAQPDGAFVVGGLEPGSYKLAVYACSGRSPYVARWYGGTTFEDATPVEVFDGKTGVANVTLPLGASVEGSVNVAGGGPGSGICVSAYDANGSFLAETETDSTGHYTVQGVPPGDAFFLFSDCSSPQFAIEQWYPDAEIFRDAAPIESGGPGSSLSLAPVTLALGGSFSGVVAAAGGGPLSPVCVAAMRQSGELAASATTNAAGRYEVGGLQRGFYNAWVYDCSRRPRYVASWVSVPNEPIFDIEVRDGFRIAAIGSTLQLGGLVNGRVTDALTSAPIAPACVYAYDTDDPPNEIGDGITGFTGTDGLGYYQLPLAADQHKIWFADCGDGSHTPEWYDDKLFYDEANTVSVGGVGTKHANVNAGLSLYVAGDADCSLTVNSVDASLVLQFVAFLIEIFPCPYNGDVDLDGFITPLDAALILQYAAGLIGALPP